MLYWVFKGFPTGCEYTSPPTKA